MTIRSHATHHPPMLSSSLLPVTLMFGWEHLEEVTKEVLTLVIMTLSQFFFIGRGRKRKREGQRASEQEHFHWLVFSPVACNGQGRVRLKLGTRN